MKIIIVGAGAVGASLVAHFSGASNQIAVIERNEDLCEELKRKFDVFVVHGRGSSPDALQKAGFETADMVIAVTPSDETNLLVCHFAMQRGVKKRIARVKSDIFTNTDAVDLEQLGVTNVIEPEREVVARILQYISLPGVHETINFHDDSIFLRGYTVTEDMPIAGKTLREFNDLAKGASLLVVMINRAGKSIAPSGEQILLPGDTIVVIMPNESFKSFCTLINRKPKKLKKIVISGDSLTAIRLAEELTPLADRILLVDPDSEHAHYSSTLLNRIEVMHGDCTDRDVLHELHIDKADCFIAAGKDEEDNIMSCLLAKTSGAKMVLAVRNDAHYSDLFHSLGIDHVIIPDEITLNMIIEKIQMVPIGTYIKLTNCRCL